MYTHPLTFVTSTPILPYAPPFSLIVRGGALIVPRGNPPPNRSVITFGPYVNTVSLESLFLPALHKHCLMFWTPQHVDGRNVRKHRNCLGFEPWGRRQSETDVRLQLDPFGILPTAASCAECRVVVLCTNTYFLHVPVHVPGHVCLPGGVG